jgi:hypothetical protein
LLPEAHATPLPTLWIPRRSAVVFDVSICHCAWTQPKQVSRRRAVKTVRLRLQMM